MKKAISLILAIVCVIVMTASAFSCSVLADTRAVIALSKSTVTAGESVTVTVNVRTDKEIWGINGTLNFDNNVCSYKSASCTANDLGNKISFVDTPDGPKSYSLTVELVAVAAGTCVVSLTGCVYSDGVNEVSVPGQSVKINVTAPAVQPPESSEPTSSEAPKASANLSSLRVSGVALSPNFSVGRTSYTATVAYSVEKVTISATPADSKAKVSGIGSVNLEVGQNKRAVTVTATDGTTKTYTINIKRMTEEETAAAENPEEPTNPLAITIGEANYTIVQDISALVIPDGYTIGSETLGEDTVIGVLKDNAEKYTLYYITDESGNDIALYTRNEDGEYKRVPYMLIGSKLYIFEDVDSKLTAPEGWFITEYALTNGSVKAFQSQDTKLADFYWFYVYANGKNGFYRFDSAEGVMQRAPEFELVESMKASVDVKEKGIISKFLSMSLYGKIVIVLIAFAIICVIALVVLLIVKMTSHDEDESPFDSIEDSEEFDIVGKDGALLNAFANDNDVEKNENPVKDDRVINFEDFEDDF